VVYELAERPELFRLVPTNAQTAVEATSRIGSATFAPDGRLLFVYATVDDDRLSGCYIFDAYTRRELAYIPSSGYGDVAVDPGGRFLLLAGATGLWQWPIDRSGDRLRLGPARRILNTPDLTEVRVSESGRMAVLHGDGPNELLMMERADAPPVVMAASRHRMRFALSTDGRQLSCVGDEQHWTLWSATSRQPLGTQSGRPISVAFSPDGRWLVTSDLRELVLWDTATLTPARREFTSVDACVFSPDGTILAVRAGLTRYRLLRTDTLEELATLEVPEMAPHAVAFSPDGTLLAAFMARNLTTCVWDLRRVRAHLDQLGLDWELPAYAPDQPRDAAPLRVEIDWGSEWPMPRPDP
jgi:WD40 repeat protein